jgi:20S proteasome subunit alpha 4
LEKYYSPEETDTEAKTVKLAIRSLLEVVQSGGKNLEIAIMRKGEPMQVRALFNSDKYAG